jgi:hypothetical protein
MIIEIHNYISLELPVLTSSFTRILIFQVVLISPAARRSAALLGASRFHEADRVSQQQGTTAWWHLTVEYRVSTSTAVVLYNA